MGTILNTQAITKYFLRKFIFEEEIGEAYNKAAVVVARAGAHTVAELLALYKKCVLIPIPWVSHNEQYENANILKEKGLAIILNEAGLNIEMLLSAIDERMSSPIPTELTNRMLEQETVSSVQLITNEILAYQKKE